MHASHPEVQCFGSGLLNLFSLHFTIVKLVFHIFKMRYFVIYFEDNFNKAVSQTMYRIHEKKLCLCQPFILLFYIKMQMVFIR